MELKEDSDLAIEEDARHWRPAAIACIERSFVIECLRFEMWPGQLEVDHPFAVMLRAAYESDFGMANIMQFLATGLQYCQCMAFTDEFESPSPLIL